MSTSSTLPLVCFVEDVCEALRISRTTFKRLRRHGVFPIPELPSLDKRARFSGAAVAAFLHEEKHAQRLRSGSVSRNSHSFAVKRVAR